MKKNSKKKRRQSKALADPTQLQPMDDANGHQLQVIIETPKNCQNKYAFDHELRVFKLTKSLPAGMAFPYDFGFLPSTKAPDGDPIDVLVLMDWNAFPGCLVKARLVGVIEGQQQEKGGKKKVRNDRLVAVFDQTNSYSNVRKMSDLPKDFAEQIENFFVNYHQLSGTKYELLGIRERKTALKLIAEAQRQAKRK